MRILFVGDVFATPGLRTLKATLPGLKKSLGAALAVVNGENAAGGFGITPSAARQIFAAGADVITSGNHVWDKREMIEGILEFPRLLRPANYPLDTPGRGACVVEAEGLRVGVVNLLGRVFMDPVDSPFHAADRVLADFDREGARPPVILVDFHAEATSEKLALASHLDGRVTAVIGTHTHVPTADAAIFPGGTGYLTDAGMTGVQDSIIGLDRNRVVRRFLTGLPGTGVPAEGRGTLMGVLIETDARGRCLSIRRVDAPEV